MSPGSGIELSLLNNDPTSTLLMTPEGQPLYSIVTPVAEHDPKRESSSSDKAPSSNSDISAIPNKPTDSVHPVQRSHSYRRKALKSRTTINRLDHLHASSGHVETTVGIITYPRSTSPGVDSDSHDQPEVTLDLCEQKCVLTIEAVPFTSHINRGACVEGPRKKQASVKEGVGRHQGDGGHESSDDEWVLVAEMKNASKTKTLKQQSSVETRYAGYRDPLFFYFIPDVHPSILSAHGNSLAQTTRVTNGSYLFTTPSYAFLFCWSLIRS